jgi:LPPG:FO 2-phospho-L-lactate transferase
MTSVAVISGGVGAARFLRGLLEVVDAGAVTAIVNVGDDTVVHGLHVSPDLDTITYTLADAIDPDRGWGLRDESWRAIEQVRDYAASAGIDAGAATGNDAAGWFSLGDRDLGTHLYRTSRLRAGATLTEVAGEIARAWGLDLTLLPASDDPIRTVLTTTEGAELTFQEYFVREQHGVAIRSVRFDGAEPAAASTEVLDAIDTADVVVIAPSNPVVSIDPVLAVPGVRDAVVRRRDRVVAVSPIVGGAALKGPADRLLRELGHDASAAGVARWYAPLAATLVIDTIDRDHVTDVESAGMRCVVTDTIMSTPGVGATLARTCLDAAGAPT